MSKQREGLPDLMEQAMTGGGAEASSPAAVTPTAGDLGVLKTYSMRQPVVVMEALRAHFASRGLTLSAGVRTWLIERMEQEGLR